MNAYLRNMHLFYGTTTNIIEKSTGLHFVEQPAPQQPAPAVVPTATQPIPAAKEEVPVKTTEDKTTEDTVVPAHTEDVKETQANTSGEDVKSETTQ